MRLLTDYSALARIWRCLGWLVSCLAVLASSCLGPQLELMKEQHATLTNKVSEQDVRINQLQRQFDVEITRVYAKVNCTNDDVRDFLRRCEGPDSPGCSDQAVQGATDFMITQANVLSWLRPQQGTLSLVPLRRGELLELVDAQNLYPTTRLLILIQPRGDTAKLIEEASVIGNQMLQLLRVELGVGRERRIYGPHLLPCKLKGDAMAKYFTRKKYRAQPNEPQQNEPRVAAWVFRTDCGN